MRRGFTLVECAVAISISSLILVVVMTSLSGVIRVDRQVQELWQSHHDLERFQQRFHLDANSAAEAIIDASTLTLSPHPLSFGETTETNANQRDTTQQVVYTLQSNRVIRTSGKQIEAFQLSPRRAPQAPLLVGRWSVDKPDRPSDQLPVVRLEYADESPEEIGTTAAKVRLAVTARIGSSHRFTQHRKPTRSDGEGSTEGENSEEQNAAEQNVAGQNAQQQSGSEAGR